VEQGTKLGLSLGSVFGVGFLLVFRWVYLFKLSGFGGMCPGVSTTGAALPANPRPLRTDLSYPAYIASGNFILEFPSIKSWSRLFSRWCMRASLRGLWSRRQVWLPRMRQRGACWAGEVSLKGSHFATTQL